MSRRIRKHTNPFNVTARIGRLDREAVFGRSAPFEVDLGCGASGFIRERARNHPERDFIGLEVRKPLVEQAAERRLDEGPRNFAVFHANAHLNVADLAEPGEIVLFHVHFPDPCFKKRHRKRRILQPPLVRQMAQMLPIGGAIYAQSDVEPLAREMFTFLRMEQALEGELFPVDRPAPVPERTEWERQHAAEQEPVWRMWFTKVREPFGEVPEYELVDARPPEQQA